MIAVFLARILQNTKFDVNLCASIVKEYGSLDDCNRIKWDKSLLFTQLNSL